MARRDSFFYEKKSSKGKAFGAILILIIIIAAVFAGVYLFKDEIMDWIKGEGTGSSAATPTPSNPAEDATPEPSNAPTPTPEPIVVSANTIGDRFTVPEGYERVPVEAGSYQEYLRTFPLKAYGTLAYLWDGSVNEKASTVGVLDLSIANFKWQQCADVIMRLWGEYQFAQKAYDKISFDFYTTPVFKCDFITWASGKRVSVSGSNVSWVDSSAGEDYSYSNFCSYLNKVQEYANTATLKNQMKVVTPQDIQIGDIFVTLYDSTTGQSGHAVIIVDMAVHKETGEKIFILAEGSTPTTDAYIMENDDKSMGVWQKLDENNSFEKNGWVCKGDFIRRF